MPTLAWIILLLPLASAAAILLFAGKRPALSALLSIGAVAAGFLLSLVLAISGGGTAVSSVPWIEAGGLSVDLGLLLDPLSRLMLLVVTGVGLMIHVYSRGYMAGDPGYARFFGCLSLFMFSMLGVVLASNFVLMFVFWELVGVSSYLLIGFWHERASAADAAKKAFITNRLGDFGFILGIIMVWAAAGTVDFGGLSEAFGANPSLLGPLATAAGLLVFMGAMGKSAQFPLHVWLPDAMEGPTPVSALIHAATMVAAGVYMLARAFFLFSLPAAWPGSWTWVSGISALDVIAWIGGITSLLAALMAVQQSDIKRILAYSTLSQLGLMVLAVGCAHPEAGMYHLVTHAFFKALLFLAAGSIIVALHHEQNIWRMGGLHTRMPVTHWTFLAGLLALCGVPPLSGFYSKDGILAGATSRPVLFAVGALVTALTSFYMFRLYFVALRGRPREHGAEHAHESPAVMVWPLRLLAVASILAGFWGIDALLANTLGTEAHGAHGGWFNRIFGPISHSPLAAFMSLIATVFGFTAALALYGHSPADDPLPHRLGAASRWMRERFYLDEAYAAIIGVTHEALSRLAAWIDEWILDGIVIRGTAGAVDVAGRMLRLLQTGNLQTYAFLAAAGLAAVLWVVLL